MKAGFFSGTHTFTSSRKAPLSVALSNVHCHLLKSLILSYVNNLHGYIHSFGTSRNSGNEGGGGGEEGGKEVVEIKDKEGGSPPAQYKLRKRDRGSTLHSLSANTI